MSANLRYSEVVWCSIPVFVPHLGDAATKSEEGFQYHTHNWLCGLKLQDGRLASDLFLWHHSANEGAGKGLQAQIYGAKAKRSGQSKGFPDWVCPSLKLAIELKMPKGNVSEEQFKWLAHFKRIGWHSEIVRSFERFQELVLHTIKETQK